MARPVHLLPKAHLHLHFTGSMRFTTLLEMAQGHGIRLPRALTERWPPDLTEADTRGWFRFQRLYDAARACVRSEADMRRIVAEAAQDDADEGWYEDELVGVPVRDVDGRTIGAVTALHVRPAQDLLEVRLSDGRSGVIPFVEALVPVVAMTGDASERHVVIDPPAGLFDLTGQG